MIIVETEEGLRKSFADATRDQNNQLESVVEKIIQLADYYGVPDSEIAQLYKNGHLKYDIDEIGDIVRAYSWVVTNPDLENHRILDLSDFESIISEKRIIQWGKINYTELKHKMLEISQKYSNEIVGDCLTLALQSCDKEAADQKDDVNRIMYNDNYQSILDDPVAHLA